MAMQGQGPILEGGQRLSEPPVEETPEAAEPTQDGAPPADATPQEVFNWRWRNEQRQIPAAALDPFREAVGAPSREALITWTQQGRDVDYHRTRIREDEARLAQERREFDAQRRQFEELQTDHEGRGYGPPSQFPGAPGYGVPTPQQGFPGGYTAPAGPQYANPYQPYMPGGFPPVAQPWGNQGYGVPPMGASLPQDPAAREQMVLSALLSIPQQVRAAVDPFIGELRTERQSQTRAAIEARAREEEAQLGNMADKYVEQLKADGFAVDGIDGATLIEDMNRMGLSANPRIPWTEALETVAARRVYRHSFQAGQGSVAATMATNPEATFHVPPTKAPASTGVQENMIADPKAAMQARAEAARKRGAAMTFRQAVDR